jgi:hypothetical protein
MHNWRANRMQSRTCSSYAEVMPTIDEVNAQLGYAFFNAQCTMHNWRANRMQSRTCSSYAEVMPTIDEVNA